ncbi:hypothetical protein CH63R_08155 [Colletotrichum higginsianum IMI 349063]|uniref:Uncharacterized protein n=1 Tax=Colletotrichum higginsianum (strain IMI 349063) TaxID=759273 RepID=A0A1B7YC30_COLHI|nr:hypothetical protein CH63R_08155 [Colletotrichum higginsianum IMI 349063]OBR09390.1 hypothetical protein CH63R_08155 [Colletotrichum higginsianum IMI 349063]
MVIFLIFSFYDPIWVLEIILQRRLTGDIEHAGALIQKQKAVTAELPPPDRRKFDSVTRTWARTSALPFHYVGLADVRRADEPGEVVAHGVGKGDVLQSHLRAPSALVFLWGGGKLCFNCVSIPAPAFVSVSWVEPISTTSVPWEEGQAGARKLGSKREHAATELSIHQHGDEVDEGGSPGLQHHLGGDAEARLGEEVGKELNSGKHRSENRRPISKMRSTVVWRAIELAHSETKQDIGGQKGGADEDELNNGGDKPALRGIRLAVLRFSILGILLLLFGLGEIFKSRRGLIEDGSVGERPGLQRRLGKNASESRLVHKATTKSDLDTPDSEEEAEDGDNVAKLFRLVALDSSDIAMETIQDLA